MLDNKYDVIVAGHLCLDVIPQMPDEDIDQVFREGKLVNIGPITLNAGGPVSNTGMGLKILGMKVGLIAKVGCDDIGRLAIEHLKRTGDTDGISISADESTSYSIALASPSFDRIILHCPGANDSFGFSDINYALLSKARHFHFGYPPLMRRMYEDGGSELVKIFARAKDCNLSTSLDMSLPDPTSASGRVDWTQILEDVLPHVDIFLPSIEEALYMVNPKKFQAMKSERNGAELIDYICVSDYIDIAATMLSMGAKIVALKSAHRGIYLRSADEKSIAGLTSDDNSWADREVWCPAYRMDKVSSAIGAGDSSIAGFLCAFLRGLGLEKTLKCANYVGYRNLHAMDALNGIQDWQTTKQMVELDDVELNDPQVDAPGWYWDNTHRIMLGPNDRNSHFCAHRNTSTVQLA